MDMSCEMTRETLRNRFLKDNGWQRAKIHALPPDASFRNYFRLEQPDQSMMLMDAPPEYENAATFVRITEHLQRLGIRAPAIHRTDLDNGFVLLEDLGDDTFTRLIDSGSDESGLYDQAIDLLTALHNHPYATSLNIGNYDWAAFIKEAKLFTDWYLPAQFNAPASDSIKSGYIDAWRAVFDDLPTLKPTLTLRDYHVDNLMRVNHRCAVLDYQDALIGSPAYDVVSLLEDARRDIDPRLAARSLERYLKGNGAADEQIFAHHYDVWGAQRHCKVAGIFMRLWLRDDKPVYLKHLSRVTALLAAKLRQPALQPIARWFEANDIDLKYRKLNSSRQEIRQRIDPVPPSFPRKRESIK